MVSFLFALSHGSPTYGVTILGMSDDGAARHTPAGFDGLRDHSDIFRWLLNCALVALPLVVQLLE